MAETVAETMAPDTAATQTVATDAPVSEPAPTTVAGAAETTITTAATEPASTVEAAAEADIPEIVGIRLDSPETVITALLGQPASKSPSVEEGATGDVVSTWSWPAAGVTAKMADVDGLHFVRSLTITSPSQLGTAEGIAVGSTEAQVRAAYGDRINTEESRPGMIVVGSIFGGLLVTLTDGVVTELFVGAAAE